MILYFADRGFNVLGLAGDKIKRGYNIVNDEEEIDVENGVATFSFDIFYSDETRSDIEKLVYVGNYVLRKDGNEFKAYTIIDTDQSTENRTINVRAEDMGLDLINDIALPFNYETADYEKNVDHAAEGNAANKGYINENGSYVADNNYRATNHMGLGTTPPEAWLFRVTKSEVGTKRYSVAFYNSSKTFIPGSGKYYYLSDSEQISRIETPAGAKYVRISFHKDITSAYFVASSVKSYPITTYVENCVGNSGFEIGLNEIGDVRLPLEFDDTQTCSERLKEVVSSFGAELGFSFEFKNLVISKKMVNLYSHRGADNRVELRMGRDVKNIRISRSVADLATAIIAIGKTVDDKGEEVLFTLDGYSGTIESGYYIEGSKLCSQKAYSKWSRYLSASGKRSGHIVKNFEYECGSQQSLYEYALADLKAIEEASVTYEVELFTLPPYVGLGDTVYVVDDLGEIYISARVLSIRRSEINDTISVELGEFVTKTSGLVDEWSIFRQRFAAWSAANAPRYVWVAYADDKSGTGISLDPTGKNWMGIADDRKSKEVDLSDPTIFNWIQLTAKDGKDGAGVRSTTVTYAVSAGPNVMPGNSDWQNTLPSVDKGKCLWTRTVTDYTDDTIPDTITYTYAIQGADGQNGQPGQNGVSVEVSSIEYVSWPTEQTPPDTASWSTTIPMVLPGDFLWTRTTFSDGKKAYGKARQGKDGKRGAEWYTGTGITGTSTTATIFSGSGVSSAVVGDMYLNTSTYNTYRCTVAGNASTAKWVYVNNIKGLKGDPGTNGTNGKDGTNGTDGDDGRGVSSIDREYYLSTSNTTQSGGYWSTTPAAYVSGRYYWSRDKIVWTNPAGTTYTTAVLDNGLNSANSTAASAQSTANTANSTANTAKSTADTAKSTADTAKSTADNAASAAATAQSAANAAQTAADKALDRRLHNNFVKTAAVVKSKTFIVGTKDGYKTIAANEQFDLNYPILYYEGSDTLAGASITAYEAIPDVNPTYTMSPISDAAIDKTLWLKVMHIAGSRFAVAESNFLTTTTPTVRDDYYYIPLGPYSHDSTAKMYFTSNDRLYAVPESAETYVHNTYSGQLVSIDNPIGDSIIESTKLTFEPIQEGTGDPSPTNVRPITGRTSATVTRTGKNLLNDVNPSVVDGYLGRSGSNGKIVPGSTNKTVIVPCMPNTTYTWTWNPQSLTTVADDSGILGFTEYPIPNTTVGVWMLTNTTNKASRSFTTKADTKYLAIKIARVKDTDYQSTLSASQLELGSTATPYESYQGQTVAIDLDGTVYGGELDVATGVLTLTKGYKIFDGTETWRTEYTYNFYSGTGRGTGKYDYTYLCSHFRYNYSSANGTDTSKFPSAFISSTGDFNLQRSDIAHTGDAMKQWCLQQYQAGTPLTIVYDLNEPQTIQLTPEQLSLVLGMNHIYTDATSITVNMNDHITKEFEFQPLDTAGVLSSRSFKSVVDTYRDEQNGVLAGVRTQINSVQTDVGKLREADRETARLINDIRNEIKVIYVEDPETGQKTGVIADVASRINALSGRVDTAMSYVDTDGLKVETSETQGTVTTIQGNGFKVVDKTDPNKELIFVNTVQTFIRDASIIGFLDVAGTSLSRKVETEYDGTDSHGLAFYN